MKLTEATKDDGETLWFDRLGVEGIEIIERGQGNNLRKLVQLNFRSGTKVCIQGDPLDVKERIETGIVFIIHPPKENKNEVCK